MVLIGIDPGVQTGFCVIEDRDIVIVSSGLMTEIQDQVLEWKEYCERKGKGLRVYVEDARLRKWYPNKSHAVLQGVGSVKRSSQLWESFLTLKEIDFEMVHPIKGGTKWKADTFKRITGWEKRTNKHGRDAAMLIFGR